MGSLYQVYELIGEGSFGKVYRARCYRTNNQVAYKVISINGRSKLEVQALRRECEIQKHLGHPNIIRMLHSFENENELVVITEFAGKDLCHILKEQQKIEENVARRIICDLVSALYYLHSNRILHRDLKPQNVLLDANGNAKLCDFGFAKVLCKDSQMVTSIKGTPLYMAPELINQHPYDHNADLWSLGCIAYELVTGDPPYTTKSIWQLIEMIKVQPIKWPRFLSETCMSLLKGLLQKNSLHRLSWPQLLYHPFVNPNVYSYIAAGSAYQNHHVLPSYVIPRTEPFLNTVSYGREPQTTYNEIGHESREKFIPSHIIEIRDQSVFDSIHSRASAVSQKYEHPTLDPSQQAQKEEWLECLRKTISSIMYDGDVDELTEKHSFMLIMNTFNNYSKCPIIVYTVARLLSLPFVVENVPDTELARIRKMYASCNVIQDLLLVVKTLATGSEEKELNVTEESALQQLLVLICNLIFTDQTVLQQFFKVSISLNLFKTVKIFLSIRTKKDPLSVVKYVISIFLRLYIIIPQSRQFVFQAFNDCTSKFHSLLQECEDMNVHVVLCTFITVLGCTQANFLRKSPDADINLLISDLNQLKSSSHIPSVQQATSGSLVVLKKLDRS